jgi:hypothetical protein
MLPSLTSFIRTTDTPVAKEIMKEANKGTSVLESKTNGTEPMETNQDKETTKKENMFLFAEKDADVSEHKKNENTRKLCLHSKKIGRTLFHCPGDTENRIVVLIALGFSCLYVKWV